MPAAPDDVPESPRVFPWATPGPPMGAGMPRCPSPQGGPEVPTRDLSAVEQWGFWPAKPSTPWDYGPVVAVPNPICAVSLETSGRSRREAERRALWWGKSNARLTIVHLCKVDPGLVLGLAQCECELVILAAELHGDRQRVGAFG